MRDRTGHVYQELRERILDGQLLPSETLTEVTIAAELGVSRSTVRKALLKLESECLVVIEENKRARVRSFSLDEVLQSLEVREVLEGFIARQAAPLLGADKIEEMRAILGEMTRCIETRDLMEYSWHNWRFHEAVYGACPNQQAVELTLAIKNRLKRFNIRTILIRKRAEDSLDEHREIFAALEAGDAEAADVLMRRHIANVRDVIGRHRGLLL